MLTPTESDPNFLNIESILTRKNKIEAVDGANLTATFVFKDRVAWDPRNWSRRSNGRNPHRTLTFYNSRTAQKGKPEFGCRYASGRGWSDRLPIPPHTYKSVIWCSIHCRVLGDLYVAVFDEATLILGETGRSASVLEGGSGVRVD